MEEKEERKAPLAYGTNITDDAQKQIGTERREEKRQIYIAAIFYQKVIRSFVYERTQLPYV